VHESLKGVLDRMYLFKAATFVIEYLQTRSLVRQLWCLQRWFLLLCCLLSKDCGGDLNESLGILSGSPLEECAPGSCGLFFLSESGSRVAEILCSGM